jgi:hypothetical protein
VIQPIQSHRQGRAAGAGQKVVIGSRARHIGHSVAG